MKATGLFFLRMHACTFADESGARVGVRLTVIERDPQDHRSILNELTAIWRGEDALAFYDANSAELRAGRPLQLELDRLRVRDGELHGTATHCELAPLAPSWQKHADVAAALPAPSTTAA